MVADASRALDRNHVPADRPDVPDRELLHLLPVLGVSAGRSSSVSTGLIEPLPDLTRPELVLLMRHRALLFVGLGALLVGTALVPWWHTPTLILGLLGAAGFILLARGQSLDDPPRWVASADWIAVVTITVTALGMILAHWSRGHPPAMARGQG